MALAEMPFPGEGEEVLLRIFGEFVPPTFSLLGYLLTINCSFAAPIYSFLCYYKTN